MKDLARVGVVLTILSSAVGVHQTVDRLLTRGPWHLWAVAAAPVIDFLSNEAVAVLRARTGRQITVTAIAADCYHARTDGHFEHQA